MRLGRTAASLRDARTVQRIRCSSTRSAILSAFICLHPLGRLSSASDEKSQIQALDRDRSLSLPMIAWRSRALGATTVSATGPLRCSPRCRYRLRLRDRRPCYKRSSGRRRCLDFLKQRSTRRVPEASSIVRIAMDNYATHENRKDQSLVRRADPTTTCVLTPIVGVFAGSQSACERWFADADATSSRAAAFTPPLARLEADIRTFIDRHNEQSKALQMDQIRR